MIETLKDTKFFYGALVAVLLVLCLPSAVLAQTEAPLAQTEAPLVSAGKISSRMSSILKVHAANLKMWTYKGNIIVPLLNQNKANMTLEEIKKIDTEWIAGKQKEFAKLLQRNKAGRFLRSMVESSSLYVEAFLCDKQGAVVGEYPKTSDYWQGDEDKFIKSFNNANGITYIGEMEFDESTQINAVQVSIPVIYQNETIGVLVVGLKNVK